LGDVSALQPERAATTVPAAESHDTVRLNRLPPERRALVGVERSESPGPLDAVFLSDASFEVVMEKIRMGK